MIQIISEFDEFCRLVVAGSVGSMLYMALLSASGVRCFPVARVDADDVMCVRSSLTTHTHVGSNNS